MPELKIALSPPQSKFFMSQAKFVNFCAGMGSGKSHVGTVRLIASILQDPTCSFLYMAPTHNLIKTIFYPLIEEFLRELGIGYTINKSDSVISVDGHGQIYCRSMTDPATLIGITVLSVFMDEIDTIPADKAEMILKKALGRMRQNSPNNTPNQLFVFSTPEGYKFSYNNWKKNPLPNSELIIASTYTNEHNLPDDFIETMKSTYPSNLFDAYVNGIFTNLQSGTVYYSFDRNVCHCDSVYRDGEEIHCGIDFNVLDCSVTVGVKRNRQHSAYKDGLTIDGVTGEIVKEELHIIDGLYHLNDTNEIAEVLRNKYPRSPVYVYPDSSGKSTSSKSANKSDFTILKKAGFHIKAKNKNPLVKERVMSLNGALEHHKVRVNVSNCKELVESLEQQVYNANTGQPEKLVNSSIDDINDSFGYLVYYLYPIKKMTASAVKLGGF